MARSLSLEEPSKDYLVAPFVRRASSFKEARFSENVSPNLGSIPRDVPGKRSAKVQPKLVRGYTGLNKHDLQEQKTLVASVLPGWQGIDETLITCEDKSGAGGSKTYKVSAKGVEPPVVALHSRINGDDASEERMEAAGKAFSDAGVAPRRLAQGGDWYIERWEGEQPWNNEVGGTLTHEHLQDAADLLARVHAQVPIAWYEEHRQKIIERNPIFADALVGSHAWGPACCLSYFRGGPGSDPQHIEDVTRFYVNAGTAVNILPEHPLAARIVACHGDFQPGNYISTKEDGLKCIDLEFACVGYAVHDVAYAFKWIPREKRRIFVEAYIKSCGLSEPTSEDVEAFWFDAECASLRSRGNNGLIWFELYESQCNSGYNYNLYRKIEEVEKEVRANPTLRKEVLDKGFLAIDMSNSALAEEKERQGKANENLHAQRQRAEAPVALSDGEWLCRVDVQRPMAWRRFQQLAEFISARLPTDDEISLSVAPFQGDDLWVPVQREDKTSNEWINLGHDSFPTEKPPWGMMDFGHQPANMVEPWRPRFFYCVASTPVARDDTRAKYFRLPKVARCLGKNCKMQRITNENLVNNPGKGSYLKHCCPQCMMSDGLEHGGWCEGQVWTAEDSA